MSERVMLVPIFYFIKNQSPVPLFLPFLKRSRTAEQRPIVPFPLRAKTAPNGPTLPFSIKACALMLVVRCNNPGIPVRLQGPSQRSALLPTFFGLRKFNHNIQNAENTFLL